MPLSIVRETEGGADLQRVDDVEDVIIELIGRVGRERLRLLGYVDPYGDTVFNQLQCADVLGDVEKLGEVASPHQRQLLAQVRELVQRCKREVHEYVKLYGD